ncbi:hypothetical protein [Hugenholtzia roseola]|uniref:hypothetical protein n=1 Tax=Hugenholtzia roseola TaxID=1002 RepID=UPI000478B0D0|nr:hypothetical protein [Hugenholtzia roseola]
MKGYYWKAILLMLYFYGAGIEVGQSLFFAPTQTLFAQTDSTAAGQPTLDSAALAQLTPPKSTTDGLISEASAFKLTEESAHYLSPAELEPYVENLTRLRAELSHLIRYRKAYGASDKDLEKEYLLMDELRVSYAYAYYELQEQRRSIADNLTARVKVLESSELYDIDTKKMHNEILLQSLKENIFFSSRQPNLKTPAIGHVLPNCKAFGVNPALAAIGYRIGVGDHQDKYTLIIFKLYPSGEVKAALIDDIENIVVDMK